MSDLTERETERIQATAASLRGEIFSDDEPLHLSEEEVAAYARGDVDAATCEVVESHLELCTRCKEDVEDIRALRHPPTPRRGIASWMAMAAALAGTALFAGWWLSSQQVSSTATPPRAERAAWAALYREALACRSVAEPYNLRDFRPYARSLRAQHTQ